MTLVFPRVKPLGTRSSRQRQAIGYDASYPTKSMDYLKIDIFDSKQNNPYNYVGGGGASTGRIRGGRTKETLFLYLPAGLKEDYVTDYRQVKVGASGVGLLPAAARGTTEGIGTDISKAAEAAKSTLAGQIAADAVSLANFGDSDVTGRDVAALTKRAIMNPYEETTFQGVKYRQHNFTFKLVPKSPEDSMDIQEIIHVLRTSMLPGKNSSSNLGGQDIFSRIDSGRGRGDRWLTIPDFFQLSIVRYKGSQQEVNERMSKPESLSFLMQFPTKCVLSSMSVDLTPDGQLTTLREGASGDNNEYDYGPAAYNMTLSFNETAFITKDMVQRGMGGSEPGWGSFF